MRQHFVPLSEKPKAEAPPARPSCSNNHLPPKSPPTPKRLGKARPPARPSPSLGPPVRKGMGGRCHPQKTPRSWEGGREKKAKKRKKKNPSPFLPLQPSKFLGSRNRRSRTVRPRPGPLPPGRTTKAGPGRGGNFPGTCPPPLSPGLRFVQTLVRDGHDLL